VESIDESRGVVIRQTDDRSDCQRKIGTALNLSHFDTNLKLGTISGESKMGSQSLHLRSVLDPCFRAARPSVLQIDLAAFRATRISVGAVTPMSVFDPFLPLAAGSRHASMHN
jgi:hypothetical protein